MIGYLKAIGRYRRGGRAATGPGHVRGRAGMYLAAAGMGLAGAILAFLPDPALARNQPVVCESQNYGYQHCSMKTSYGVVLVNQISRGRGECIQGESWGWDSGGVWVTQGCRAAFIQGNWASSFPSAAPPAQPAAGGWNDAGGAGFGGGRCYRPADAVACESQNYGYTRCPMKTAYGVKIVAQLSSGRGECVEGRTWGWDGGGVWVDGGCRGRFIQGNWDACGPTPGIRQAAPAPFPALPPAAAAGSGAGIPVTGMPWQQPAAAPAPRPAPREEPGGWRPPGEEAPAASAQDLAACRDSLNNYVHQQASESRRVAIDVEHTESRREANTMVVEEVAQVSTDFGAGRIRYRCKLGPSGQVIAFHASDL